MQADPQNDGAGVLEPGELAWFYAVARTGSRRRVWRVIGAYVPELESGRLVELGADGVRAWLPAHEIHEGDRFTVGLQNMTARPLSVLLGVKMQCVKSGLQAPCMLRPVLTVRLAEVH